MTLSTPECKYENFRFCAFFMVSAPIKDRFIFSSANALPIIKRKIIYMNSFFMLKLAIERKSNLESPQGL